MGPKPPGITWGPKVWERVLEQLWSFLLLPPGPLTQALRTMPPEAATHPPPSLPETSAWAVSSGMKPHFSLLFLSASTSLLDHFLLHPLPGISSPRQHPSTDCICWLQSALSPTLPFPPSLCAPTIPSAHLSYSPGSLVFAYLCVSLIDLRFSRAGTRSDSVCYS